MKPFTAQIHATFRGGLLHVSANIRAPDGEAAKASAQFILDTIAGSQKTYIRRAPEGLNQTDFDTKETYGHGYVRFHTDMETVGLRHNISGQETSLTGLGDASVTDQDPEEIPV